MSVSVRLHGARTRVGHVRWMGFTTRVNVTTGVYSG
jgi:hypothetical protein